MDSTRHLLFYSCDIETLGVLLESPIIEIGICAVYYDTETALFDYETVSKPLSFSTQAVVTAGDSAAVAVDAVRAAAWHSRTEAGRALIAEAVQTNPWPNINPVFDVLNTLYNDLCGSDHLDAIWYFRGPQFDEAMLRHASGDHSTPWQFYNVRCQRTAQAVLHGIVSTATPDKPTDAHRAGADAEYQARVLVTLMQDAYTLTEPQNWTL